MHLHSQTPRLPPSLPTIYVCAQEMQTHSNISLRKKELGTEVAMKPILKYISKPKGENLELISTSDNFN